MEGMAHGSNCMTSVSVSRHILIDALNTQFDTCATIEKHRVQMRLEAVVWTRLDRNANALSPALFAVLNRLLNRGGGVATQSIMQIADEVVSVLRIHAQECSTHNNELHLIYTVSKSLQLLHSVPCLEVWVVSRPNRSHRRRLIASISLSGVLKVGIWASGAVNADISRVVNVRASVRLAHHSLRQES